MKKKILFVLALAVVLSACKMKLSENTGTVVIDFGNTERAVGSNGLPIIKDAAMSLEINSPSTGRQIVNFSSGEEKKWSGNFPIGEIISIKVTLSTDFAKWKGSSEHSVIAGSSRIDIKLSKAPKSVGNILINVNNTGDEVTLKPASAGQSLTGIAVSAPDKLYPKIARDGIGRVYVLYKDTSSPYASYFKRFDVEGNLDTGFETALTSALTAAGVNNIKFVDNMAIDPENNYIFLFKDQTVYCFKEKEGYSFESFGHAVFPSGTTSLKVTAAAAYDDVLFVVDGSMLYACEFEFEDASGHSGAKLLKFESQATRKPLAKLRTKPAFGNNLTECTGLFADEDNVYCLLKEQELRYGNLYALGQIVRYQYSGSAFTGETKIGLNPAASTEDPIAFNAQYFSAPVGFIGYDEENIYIADDGIEFQYVNENWRIKGNKNRIAAFNRNTNEITFTDTETTWYEQKPEYKYPNTKILLWQDNIYGMYYWTSTDGTEAFSEANKLFADTSSEQPTDIFCYDQDGNLYILWNDGTGYKVRRFELKEDGSYENTGEDASLTSYTVSAIAVDISDGQNSLYYAYANGLGGHIVKYSWSLGGSFSSGSSGAYTTFNADDASVTALAANKDGVFVATKETYQESGIDKYRLKVQKYKKADGDHDSEVTLVDNAVSYTDVADSPNPIPDPSPGQNPTRPCNQYQEEINDLQIVNGMLYGISSKLHRKWISYSGSYFTDIFKHSSILYTIGDTAKSLPNNPLVKKEKPVDDTNKVGYGFYRFIAVKYDEAERIRLIIASDSAWGEGVASRTGDNTDKIVEVDLKDMLFGDDKKSGGPFSKTFDDSGFAWY